MAGLAFARAETVDLDPAANPPRSRGWLRRSLQTSVAEGMLAELFLACAGGAALTAWALYLGFGQGTVGMLCAVPVAAQVFHLPAAVLTERFGHRRLSLFAIGLSRLCWLAMPATLLCHVSTPTARATLVAVVVTSAVLGVVGNNAWVVWMGELVPASLQGRFFGRRTAALTVVGCVAPLIAGLALDLARRTGHTPLALTLLSLLAGFAGLTTLILLRRQHERRRAPRPPRPILPTLVRPFRDPGLRPLLAHQLAWNAAVGVAATFFVAYLVRDLGLGYVLVAGHGALAAAARLCAAPGWGRTIDRVGSARVIFVTGLGLSGLPLLWILATPDRLWPLALDAVLGGALSAGHGLALFGLPLRIAPRDAVASYVGALSSAAGGAFALACLGGGLLAAQLPAQVVLGGQSWFALDLLFLVAAVARLLGAGLAWPLARRGGHGAAGHRRRLECRRLHAARGRAL